MGVMVAGHVYGQATVQPTDVVKRPAKVSRGPVAVTESTFAVFPQIDLSVTQRARRPSNPRITMWRDLGRPNNLPTGSVTTAERGTPDVKWPAIDNTGWFPPDPDLAVGPNHIVAVVNSSIAFFTKTGTKLFQQQMGPVPGPTEGFFESLGAGPFVFDPKAFYDKTSGRFFVVALELDEAQRVSKLLIGVSATDNPQGLWHKYRIESKMTIGGTESWLDYPGFAANKDAVVVTGNMFGFSPMSFTGAGVVMMSKAQMLTGGAPTLTYFDDPASFTIQATRMADADQDRIYGLAEESSNSLRLFAFTNLTGTPVMTSRSVTVPSYQQAPWVAPSTSGQFLDTLGGRIMNSYARAGRLVGAHTIQRPGSSDSQVRWYDIRPNGWPTSGQLPTLAQSGNVSGSNGQHYFMPAVNINKANDISVIFTRSSSSITADLMMASRKQSDAPGTMGAPRLLDRSTSSSYALYRWGDYFGMEVDPVDDLRFWGIGMTAVGGSWGTSIHSWTVTLPGEGDPANTFNATSISMHTGTSSTGAVTAVHNSNNQFFDVTSVLIDRMGQVAAAEATFQLNKPGSDLAQMVIRSESNAPMGTTGMLYIYDWKKDEYVHLRSYRLSPTGDNIVVTQLQGNLPDYVSSTGQVKVILRGIAPLRYSRGEVVSIPPLYVHRIDLLQLGAIFSSSGSGTSGSSGSSGAAGR
jgi:hypothetical protein